MNAGMIGFAFGVAIGFCLGCVIVGFIMLAIYDEHRRDK